MSNQANYEMRKEKRKGARKELQEVSMTKLIFNTLVHFSLDCLIFILNFILMALLLLQYYPSENVTMFRYPELFFPFLVFPYVIILAHWYFKTPYILELSKENSKIKRKQWRIRDI